MNVVPFSSLSPGDHFWVAGKEYMKIVPLQLPYYPKVPWSVDENPKEEVNAVQFFTGQPMVVAPTQKVEVWDV